MSAVEESVDNATELPFGVVVAAAAHTLLTNDALDSVTLVTLVFQLEDGGELLRQSFGVDPDLAVLMSEALLNPEPITESET